MRIGGGTDFVGGAGFDQLTVDIDDDPVQRSDFADTLTGDNVKFGATVMLVDEDTDEEVTYKIIGSHEADAKNGSLSITSPLARALIGKTQGDSAEVNTPKGAKSYEILDVTFK